MTEPTRDRPLEAKADPDEEIVFTRGELDAADEADRRNRSIRTGAQAGLGGALIVLGDWVVGGFLEVDLDPKNPESVELPVTVSAALLVVGAWLVARRMNRAPKA